MTIAVDPSDASPSTSPTDTRHEIAAGVRAMLPWLIGVVPFGMVVGMTARTSGLSTAVGLATGATIYSGSAQLTAIGLIADGASIVVVVASVMIINARLLLYGGSIAPHWRRTGRGFRAVAAYLLVDPSFVVGMQRYDADRRGGHVHYLAAGVTLWVAWHAAILAGAGLGAGVPEWLSLHYAVPLFLLAELVRVASSRPALAAAGSAAVIVIVASELPLHSSLLVAVIIGVGCGFVSGRRTS